MAETKNCRQCQDTFEITDADLAFYQKISPTFAGQVFEIPTPALCPDCRQRRRLTFRNERNLYKRKSDLTGKDVISTYAPNAEAVIYAQEEWWGDGWDPLAYGRDFDFSRPFFEQIEELGKAVPRPCILNFNSENSEHTNHCDGNKNCYMCINTGYSEDCYYCTNYNIFSKDCVDCLAIQHSEQCYYCVNTTHSSFSKYLINCINCGNCSYCFDCQYCSDCFGCWNLRHKQYQIFNQQYSKEEYQAKLKEMNPRGYEQSRERYASFLKDVQEKAIHRQLYILQCENSTGDRLWNNKNVRDSYYTFDCEDSAYCYDCGALKDSEDVTEPFKGELEYETHACNDNYHILFCSKSYENRNSFYCQYCFTSSDLFGCIGIKHKQYCILNKQYSPEEYAKTVAKIIAHMQQTDEWGEFFPTRLSPYSYNETAAYDYYPLDKKQATELGAHWQDEDHSPKYEGEIYIPQDDIDVYVRSEEERKKLLAGVLRCEVTGKPFKITPPELAFYMRNEIPIPRMHFDQRFIERFQLRNPRRLFSRQCDNCHQEIISTFSQSRPEKVYCEECYQRAVV